MAKSVRWQLNDAQATHQAGIKLGRCLAPGHLVTLSGELGAGKTTLCRGIAEGLGVADLNQVTSPTYALMHEYQAARCAVVHIDAYRLADASHATELGLEEAWLRKDAVIVIEWPERLVELLPQADVAVRICIGSQGASETRTLDIEADQKLDDDFQA